MNLRSLPAPERPPLLLLPLLFGFFLGGCSGSAGLHTLREDDRFMRAAGKPPIPTQPSLHADLGQHDDAAAAARD